MKFVCHHFMVRDISFQCNYTFNSSRYSIVSKITAVTEVRLFVDIGCDPQQNPTSAVHLRLHEWDQIQTGVNAMVKGTSNIVYMFLMVG